MIITNKFNDGDTVEIKGQESLGHLIVVGARAQYSLVTVDGKTVDANEGQLRMIKKKCVHTRYSYEDHTYSRQFKFCPDCGEKL